MTADQLMPCLGCDDLRCNDCFESKCRELGYTRPTAVASHAEGDWRKADLWIEYAANGNIRYFTQDPESADVHRKSIASEGRELIPYFTHPPRSGDEAEGVPFCPKCGSYPVAGDEARDAATEEWLNINDVYLVSNQGRVMHGNRVLKPYKKAKGYLAVSMWKNGMRAEEYVHRLVAEAFIPRENELQDQVNHRDGDRTNNVSTNLEWCTAQENRIHSAKVMYVGTRPVIATNVTTGEELHFESLADAEQHGFKRSNIQKCLSGTRKMHGGYSWREAIDAAMAARGGS